ncbi:MAG: radical SAM protein [Chloroflexi bacterium]|nr:radical SAM protein [Chloroflexota bacterium]
MVIRQVEAKSILSRSKVCEYVVNPYTGCQHACSYCYARFMRRFTGHKEPWGDFVDIKINAADLLRIEIKKKAKGRVWVSGVCDPYQPVEARYRLTRSCLEILVQNDWPVTIQTRSPLVLRDIELLKGARDLDVGITVTTGDDTIRRLFEPHAPSIKARIRTIEVLHRSGIRTFAMIAPVLPKAELLASELSGKVDYVLIDRMNYHYGDWVYRDHKLESAMGDDFFLRVGEELASAFKKAGVECRLLF